MTQLTAPMLEFLVWLSDRPRTYGETIEAWRSTCPRLSIWEDAVIAGYARLDGTGGTMKEQPVVLTERGRAALKAQQTEEGQAQPRAARELVRA